MDRDSELRELAQRIVEGDFVPFIGAGCSRDLLQGFDWAGITRATADALGIEATPDAPAIAQQYEDKFGREALVRFLDERLTITEFEDSKGQSQIALMELRFPVYYTTNVDNVTETCYARYGHGLTVIVEPSDLKKRHLAVPALMKFHGDTKHADRLVWTTNDYAKRKADDDNFMHVVLRADLLVHSFMFIGYSLSPDDAHVRSLLLSMQEKCAPAMRDSVLILYGNRGEGNFSEFGIRIIATGDLYPHLSSGEALQQFLTDLGVEVKKIDTERELQDLLTPAVPSPVPVLSDYDLKSAELTIPNQPVGVGVNTFRATCDGTRIPKDFQERVFNLYSGLCRRAGKADVQPLIYATLNLYLSDGEWLLRLYAEAYALHHLDEASIVPIKGPNETPDFRAALIAMAAAILKERNIPRNQTFANWVVRNAHFGNEVLQLLEAKGTKIKDDVVAAFDDIFKGSARTNPLKADYKPPFPIKTFGDIAADMQAAFPKSPKRPF
jgi:hypothetical protein